LSKSNLSDQLAESKGKVAQLTSTFEEHLKGLDLPNRLSLARVAAVPVFMASFLLGFKCASFYVYVFACLTDFLDGFLARRWNQTSAFGAFLDPVADKLMVATALILLTARFPTMIYIFPVALIMFREVGVSALREWMAERGQRNVVKVGQAGKAKTAFQMVATALLLMVVPDNSPGVDLCLAWGLSKPLVFTLGMALLYASTFLTVYSGAQYLQAALPTLKGAGGNKGASVGYSADVSAPPSEAPPAPPAEDPSTPPAATANGDGKILQ